MCVYVDFLPVWLCVFLVLGSSKLLVDLEYSTRGKLVIVQKDMNTRSTCMRSHISFAMPVQ